jgi:diguanylate cyclase (GGDEF)-like protein
MHERNKARRFLQGVGRDDETCDRRYREPLSSGGSLRDRSKPRFRKLTKMMSLIYANQLKTPRWAVALSAILGVCALGWLDALTGGHASISLFYLVPIAIVSRRFGLMPGLTVAVWAGVMRLGLALWLRPNPANGEMAMWNAGLELGFFSLVALLVDRWNLTSMQVESAATTDPLTGIANRRGFNDQVAKEIALAARYGHPLSVAYLDLDDFKILNDCFGHQAGDQALCRMAATFRSQLRATDFVARLGGDEFAIVMPQTGPDAVHAITRHMQTILAEPSLAADQALKLSIGVVTYLVPPESVDALLDQADRLMYDVKRSGKGGMRHQVVADAVQRTATFVS